MITERRTTHKIAAFTDLESWQEGHQLVLRIYFLTKDGGSTSQETYQNIQNHIEATQQFLYGLIKKSKTLVHHYNLITMQSKYGYK